MLIQLAPNLFNNQAEPILHTCRKCNALITKLEWAWDQEIMSKPLQGRFLVKIDETWDRETRAFTNTYPLLNLLLNSFSFVGALIF